ncbi:MAG: ribonuclease HII [Verrucomicrobiota bacterium]|nr:ribonuclease HII [Verrucomicrobiota bacterium]
MQSLLAHDQQAVETCEYLAGIDEAGRGALAGPVVAAAVIVRKDFFTSEWCRLHAGTINDSKQLKAAQRELNYTRIIELAYNGGCWIGIGQGSVEEIATHNILGATRLAMRRALETAAASAKLPLTSASAEPDLFSLVEEKVTRSARQHLRILVDGRPLKPFPYRHEGLVGGDGKSLVIAMASNLAKVTRDALLVAMENVHPGYGLAVHKGYATPQHCEALAKLGPCCSHRALFLRKLKLRQEG